MTRATRIIGLGAAATLCALLAWTPATGANVTVASDLSSICNPLAGTSLISGSDGSTASIAGRGGQIREPELAQVHEDLPASAKGRARATFSTTVPGYFHVITDGATGSLTSRQIDDQMRVLNQTFAGWEGGASTAFAFRLAGSTRTDNAAWFELDHGVAEQAHRVPVRAERRGAHQKRPLSSRRR
jgi:hypothetical protein